MIVIIRVPDGEDWEAQVLDLHLVATRDEQDWSIISPDEDQLVGEYSGRTEDGTRVLIPCEYSGVPRFGGTCRLPTSPD